MHLSNVSRPCPLDGKARFVIELPDADAKLFVDGKRFDPGEGKVVREFTTTTLKPGKHYRLTLRADVNRDGKVVTATRQLTFGADSEHRLYLQPLATPPGGG